MCVVHLVCALWILTNGKRCPYWDVYFRGVFREWFHWLSLKCIHMGKGVGYTWGLLTPKGYIAFNKNILVHYENEL